MQGFTALTFMVVAFIAGLEMSSPGVSFSVIKAVVSLDHAAKTHVGARICARLPDGDTFEACQGGTGS